MAKFSLVPFNEAQAPKIKIEVELNQNHESLFISYRINSGLDRIDLGSPTPKKERLIKLWEQTCFEFFIKNFDDTYLEFNFSPNFSWNCFYFPKPGSPLAEWERMNRPNTEILLSDNEYFLIAELKKELFPKNFFDKPETLSASITAVIKDKTAQMSYWALIHKDTRPNFHHMDSFKYRF